MNALDLEYQRLDALCIIRANLLELKWLAAATRFELAMHRHYWALKAGFNPDQPRIPKPNPGGGRWTDAGMSSGRIRLAGDIPTGDSPEIPEERPKTSRERTAVKKEVARQIAEFGMSALGLAKISQWLVTYRAEIETYNDPPKSFEELRRDTSTTAPGYDIHHIVERNQEDRFTREAINSPDNLVRVPRLKHQEINSWYQTKNDEFGGMSPREYLSGRSWEVHRSVGLDALRKYGVLKP